MFFRLALRNVKRQAKNALIYFLTISFIVALLFSACNMIFNENILILASAGQFRGGLIGLIAFISAIVAFVLSYATSFLLKLRKREFGTYLILGMTRKNISVLFLSEITAICLGALALGLPLGLFVYQGFSAVAMRILDMEFVLAAYSAKGLALSICLIAGIFLLASLTSWIYLQRVSIYDLLHGDQKEEKPVQHSALWAALSAVSLGALAGSLCLFDAANQHMMSGTANAAAIMACLFTFAVATILFHVALARSAVSLLLRAKKFCSKSTNTFVLRQLSTALRSNSLLMGFLSILLAFTIIGSNAAIAKRASQQATLNRNCPYDILYTHNLTTESASMPAAEAEALIQKYAGIRSRYAFQIYETGNSEFFQHTKWPGFLDRFMKLSDFNALVAPLGFETVELSDQFMVVSTIPEVRSQDWSHFVYKLKGKRYICHAAREEYPMLGESLYIVMPDDAFHDMQAQTEYVAYMLENSTYDVYALQSSLASLESGSDPGMPTGSYTLREYIRQEQNGMNASLIIGALFIAMVFLCMSLAILALKTLSTLAEDRRRYTILSRLGAGGRELRHTLLRQMFCFFIVPFGIPLLTSFPVVRLGQNALSLSGMAELAAQLPAITAMTSGAIALLYFLYFAAAYNVARRNVLD